MKIGYVPYSAELTQPGDRRRFPYYAGLRGLDFELAEPDGSYDVVVITPRTDLARWAEYRPGEARIVFDMVDSYLDIPSTNPKQLLRGPVKFLTGQSRTPFFSWRASLEKILRRADAATCATPEQAAAISPYCSNTYAALDFQTELLSEVKEDYSAGTPFKLVWEGLGENLRWFSEIREALAEISRTRPLELHVVTQPRFKQIAQRFWTRDTAKIAAGFFDEVVVHEWTEGSVAATATGCDLAVIPLPLDRPLEAGKPESKLIAFWRMGLPVLVSSTPAYVRVMTAAGQNLHCHTNAEWAERLTVLHDDQAAREHAGRSGRAFADAAYADDRLAAVWDAAFASL